MRVGTPHSVHDCVREEPCRQSDRIAKSLGTLRTWVGFLYYPPFVPTYLRGQAYLKLRDGSRAATEFQRILGHRSLDPVSPIYALAHLGLGRARALTGDVMESITLIDRAGRFLTEGQ